MADETTPTTDERSSPGVLRQAANLADSAIPDTIGRGINLLTKTDDRSVKQTPTSKFQIQFDAGEFDSDSPVLSEQEAFRIIRQRLPIDKGMYMAVLRESGEGSNQGASSALVELSRKIAVLLPDEAMTRDALENMDLRPALQQVMMSTQQESNADGTSDVNGVEFSDMERRLAGITLVTLTETYKEQWGEIGADAINKDMDVARQTSALEATLEDVLYGYRDGRSVRVPDASSKTSLILDPETGEMVANSSDIISEGMEGEFNAEFDVSNNEAIERRFLSTQDIRKMLAGGEIDIDFLRSTEQADIMTDPTATDPNAPRSLDHAARINYTDNTRDSGNNLPDHLSSAKDTENDWYSVTQALQLPSTFTPEERVAIVKRLENAGFLEKGAVVGGDTTSSAFKNAWKQLASSALERGVSMTSFLDEREKTYQETIMSSFATRLTDPARLKLSGNTLGQQALGRKLTDDEHAKMIEFVHGLEKQNAMTEAGLDATEGAENGVTPLDEGVTADIDARMQEWIKDENSAEAGAHDMADQYEQFTRMLGGPGRGVS